MKYASCFILGLVFSVGLSISGMVNPNKIIGFLDIFGQWDPSLIFVMGGAALLNLILFKFILKRQNPIFESKFNFPQSNLVDWRLIAGSVIFGIGWGIGGVCPGPGIANLFLGKEEMIAFIISMLVGMAVFHQVNKILPK